MYAKKTLSTLKMQLSTHSGVSWNRVAQQTRRYIKALAVPAHWWGGLRMRSPQNIVETAAVPTTATVNFARKTICTVLCCNLVGSRVNFCLDIKHAETQCRRFCGFCSMVDGGWASWEPWSPCDVTCGNGTQTRARTCTDPIPANGGGPCVGMSQETFDCTLDLCPVHGGWSMWSSWGSCSSSCDIGMKRRDRSCSNPYPSRNGDHCFGDSRDDQMCFPGACANGGWSVWGQWSTCSTSCGVGVHTRSRSCDNPTPSLMGKYCLGDSSQSDTCALRPCHDGGWSDWGQWSTCTASCDVGVHTRSRSCDNPPPSLMGKYCAGDSSNTETCNLRPCPAKLSAFTATNCNYSSGYLHCMDVEINAGSGYNPSTGTFTCTFPGVYYFTVNLVKRIYNDGVYEMAAYIRKNRQNVIRIFIDPADSGAGKGNYAATGSAVLHLAKGDTVDVYNYYRIEGWSSFGGFLFSPDP